MLHAGWNFQGDLGRCEFILGRCLAIRDDNPPESFRRLSGRIANSSHPVMKLFTRIALRAVDGRW
jgi:hypothetical protein